MTQERIIGVIGGSGLYNIEGLTNQHWKKIHSPFGEPSDELLFGDLDGQAMVFLPRHGRGHTISPSDINYRANIDVLKRAGVSELLSMSAVGSLREDLVPGTFVIIDQFIDRSFAREKSFFGKGMVAHVSMAQPVCTRLGGHLQLAAQQAGIKAVRGGTYMVMEGPQFSTQAESELYRSWGCDVIGMTNMPEAKLAREAEICYATVAMVTDFDCWHPEHENVSVEAVISTLLGNAKDACNLLKTAAPIIGADASIHRCSCQTALNAALITASQARSAELLNKLDAVAGRVLNAS